MPILDRSRQIDLDSPIEINNMTAKLIFPIKTRNRNPVSIELLILIKVKTIALQRKYKDQSTVIKRKKNVLSSDS